MLKRKKHRSGFEIAEQAVALLRRSPLRIWACYYIGSLPFAIGILTFYMSMTTSASAVQQLPGAAIVLVFLFFWMKGWQSVFSRRLLHQLDPDAHPPKNSVAYFYLFLNQGAIHSLQLLLVPIALLALFPFPRLHATFQNASVLDDGSDANAAAIFKKAFSYARFYPRQNLFLIFLLCPTLFLLASSAQIVLTPIISTVSAEHSLGPFLLSFIMVLFLFSFSAFICTPLPFLFALNIGIAIFYGARMLKVFFDIDTIFTIAPFSAIENTLFVITIALCFLCIDPFQKAAYVLRCFYTDAEKSGADLRLALQRIRTPLLALCFCTFLFSTNIHAGEIHVDDTPELDAAITQELTLERYAWRSPVPTVEQDSKGPIARTLKSIVEFFESIWEKTKEIAGKILEFFWGTDRFSLNPKELLHMETGLRLVLFLLCLGLFILLAHFAFQAFRRYRKREKTELATDITSTQPDLEDEATTAEDLPEDEWLEMAQKLVQQGNYRLATRALFLSILALLAKHQLLLIARYKTNAEYKTELNRHSHAHREIGGNFAQAACLFENLWYGRHTATKELVEKLFDQRARIQHSVSE